MCDDAVAHGVFGAPFFVVDGERFWGNDRRAQIERWLRGGSLPGHGPQRALMQLLDFLVTQAHANRLANHRLHHAMRDLTREEYLATRTSFFPSLAETLQHILEVDLYYISALHGEADMARHWDETPKHETIASLAAAQAVSDQRFIDHVAGLDAKRSTTWSRWFEARAGSSATCAATSSPICSITRCITAARPTPCSPAPRWSRRNSTSS